MYELYLTTPTVFIHDLFIISLRHTFDSTMANVTENCCVTVGSTSINHL